MKNKITMLCVASALCFSAGAALATSKPAQLKVLNITNNTGNRVDMLVKVKGSTSSSDKVTLKPGQSFQSIMSPNDQWGNGHLEFFDLSSGKAVLCGAFGNSVKGIAYNVNKNAKNLTIIVNKCLSGHQFDPKLVWS